MWTLTLMVHDQDPVALMFNTEETASAALAAVRTWVKVEHIEISDDYGRKFTPLWGRLGGALLQDIDGALEANHRMQLAQMRAQQKMQNEPLVRMASNGGMGGILPFNS